MPAEAPRASPARLCAMNAGTAVVWGAILAVSLQERSIALGNGDGVRAYATIAAAGAFVATIVQLAVGALSDRARARSGQRHAFYAAGVGLGVPCLWLFYAAGNFGALVVAFLALELVLNVAIGPYQAVIPDYVPEGRRGAASSWMAAYQSIGNAVGLLVAGFVHDLRLVALLLAVTLAAGYAVTALHVRTLTPIRAASTVSRIRMRGPLLWLLLSRGATNLGFYTLLGFLLFFVRSSLGVAPAAVTMQTALLFLTFTVAAVPGAACAARPVDRLDKRVVVAAAIALLAVAVAALAAATTLGVAYVAAAVAGIAWGAFVTADWALATALLPPGAMATSMGIWNVATTVPQVVAPLAAAPLVTALDARAAGLGARAAIVLALVEFAIGGALVSRLPRTRGARVEQLTDPLGDARRGVGMP